MKVTIIWNDEELNIDGTYYPARPMSNDRINPPEDADFEIHTIEYKGIEVQNLFSDEDFYAISEKCLTKIS